MLEANLQLKLNEGAELHECSHDHGMLSVLEVDGVRKILNPTPSSLKPKPDARPAGMNLLPWLLLAVGRGELCLPDGIPEADREFLQRSTGELDVILGPSQQCSSAFLWGFLHKKAEEWEIPGSLFQKGGSPPGFSSWLSRGLRRSSCPSSPGLWSKRRATPDEFLS